MIEPSQDHSALGRWRDLSDVRYMLCPYGVGSNTAQVTNASVRPE